MQNLLTHEVSKVTKVSHVAAFALAALLIAFPSPNHLPVDAHPSSPSVPSPSESLAAGTLPLKVVADIADGTDWSFLIAGASVLRAANTG